MRILFDIVHPAHVHFYRHLIADISKAGGEYLVAARRKDVTIDLLDKFEIEHVCLGEAAALGRFSQVRELVSRDISLAKIVRWYKPNLVLTRNPSGTHAALIDPGTKSVFDTDDGSAAGLHYKLAASADIITMPESLHPTRPGRTRQYRSYKALAYLHPNRFTPDLSIRETLSPAGRPIFILRLVSMEAAHDHGEGGIDRTTRDSLVELLSGRGQLFISSEGDLPGDLTPFRLPVEPDKLHDVLAAADLYVGDSQTVAAEAALLGTPVAHISTWSRRLTYLVELEDKYNLITSRKPTSMDILSEVDRMTSDIDNLRSDTQRFRDKLLEENVDLTSWYFDLINDVV